MGVMRASLLIHLSECAGTMGNGVALKGNVHVSSTWLVLISSSNSGNHDAILEYFIGSLVVMRLLVL